MLAERLTAQLLAGPPARDPVAVAERLLAVQGQDQKGVRLAVRARTSGLTVEDVDRALTVDRSLVIAWVNRGTLHLVRSEDFAWLHALTTPQLRTSILRRLGQEGVTRDQAERGADVMTRALADEGSLTREEVRDRLDAAGVRTQGQALIQVIAYTALRGDVVRGPMAGARQAFVLARDWLGEQPAVDRDAALAELARRYLAGHGPASDRDLSKWAGVPLRDARAGLGAIARELVEREDGLVDLAKRAPAAEAPPRLLGSFEPVLLGWASRDEVAGAAGPAIIAGGIFKPFALVGGRVAATWSLANDKVTIEPLGDMAPEDAAALDADAADVVRFVRGGRT